MQNRAALAEDASGIALPGPESGGTNVPQHTLSGPQSLGSQHSDCKTLVHAAGSVQTPGSREKQHTRPGPQVGLPKGLQVSPASSPRAPCPPAPTSRAAAASAVARITSDEEPQDAENAAITN